MKHATKLRFVCLGCHAVIYATKVPKCKRGCCAPIAAPAATIRALEAGGAS